jgi:hypothetical protein
MGNFDLKAIKNAYLLTSDFEIRIQYILNCYILSHIFKHVTVEFSETLKSGDQGNTSA